MKHSSSVGALRTLMALLTIFFSLFAISGSFQPEHLSCHGKSAYKSDSIHNDVKEGTKEELGMELFPTGSRLPDCTHACGACFPCKRVMVSFNCSAVESCPIVYKCMCKGKFYHVPSN